MIITAIICLTVIYLWHWWLFETKKERAAQQAYVEAIKRLDDFKDLTSKITALEDSLEKQSEKLNGLSMKVGFR